MEIKIALNQIPNANNSAETKSSIITPFFNFKYFDEKNKIKNLIYKLKYFEKFRNPKYIILADNYLSKYCCDNNAYYLFKYYINNTDENAYYIINTDSELYINLKNTGQTNNLILYENNDDKLCEDLFPFLLNSKIIILSYNIYIFHKSISEVPYLKFLKINHGVRYFKKYIANFEFSSLKKEKRNIIASSPYEYESFIKDTKYEESQIHKAGLIRWDRFNFIKRNDSENKCLLVSFTWRKYKNDIFKKSLYKKNLLQLLNDINFIKYLSNKKIDLIYIPHHYEISRNKNYSQKDFNYAIISKQEKFAHYIEQCSLLVTDYSSIAFDFMFQNKPVLYYILDYNDTIKEKERDFTDKLNYTLYFGNIFINKSKLIEKIKYYQENNFQLSNRMKKSYESIFYYKKNITLKVVEIINKIISQ